MDWIGFRLFHRGIPLEEETVRQEPQVGGMGLYLITTCCDTVEMSTDAWRPVALQLKPGGEWTVTDVEGAEVVWEAPGQVGRGARWRPQGSPAWVEVEAHWPDGRRAFGRWP